MYSVLSLTQCLLPVVVSPSHALAHSDLIFVEYFPHDVCAEMSILLVALIISVPKLAPFHCYCCLKCYNTEVYYKTSTN